MYLLWALPAGEIENRSGSPQDVYPGVCAVPTSPCLHHLWLRLVAWAVVEVLEQHLVEGPVQGSN